MRQLLFPFSLLIMIPIMAKAQIRPAYLNSEVPLEERVQDALIRMTTHEKIKLIHAQSKFSSAGVPRLGIRQLNMDDGPHGVREELEWDSWAPARWTNDHVVAFPSLTCLAATWNRNLATNYGHAVSEEFAFRGKDIMLGPGVNIARTPLNGRAFEYMGEDPYLAGEMVVPYIKAAQQNGIGCCLKHFVLNEQETDRFTVNVNVSERALHEIYLAPFKKAVTDAQVWTIMGSYNLWQGVHCCQNDSLLNGILKHDWHFDGAVISDWGGVTDTWQAAMGGLDIEMGSFTDGKLKEADFTFDDYYMARPLEQLIQKGQIPMSVLDDKAARVLRTIFRTAMNPDKVIGNQCSEEHYETCRLIGEEGIVLLKNDAPAGSPQGAEPVLPITPTKYKKILVVGENATRSLTQGGGSSELKTLYDIAPLDALIQRYGERIDYAQGYTSGRAIYDETASLDPAEQEQLRAEALAKAKNADLIIYIGGLNKNHQQDCENSDRESYDLSFHQNELIASLAHIQQNIIVITFGGNAYATPWLDQVKALVHCWYLGSMAGVALVNILDGSTCPSGKLPITFAKQIEDYPYYQYGEEAYPGIQQQVYYKEGIYVGYRHFDTRHIKPQFPFGFGLSYTHFKYGEPVTDTSHLLSHKAIKVKIPVTNIGTVKGKETIQLYISDRECPIDRPHKELKDFCKLELEPGETQTASFEITAEALQYYDEKAHQWRTHAGRYRVYLSAHAADEAHYIDFDF